MTAPWWRHTSGDECAVPVMGLGRWSGFPCGCTTPEPDHASPCGFEGCHGMPARHLKHVHGRHGRHGPHPGCHDFVPSRCLRCGHDIEAAPDA